MLDVTEQLRRYGEAVEQVLLTQADDRTTAARKPIRGRSRLVVAVVAALATAAAGVWVVGRAGDDPADTTTGPRASEGVFTSPTDVVLLFTDGLDGVLAVDLDHRLASRRAIDGERAGDQPFRLTLTAERLVVGWGEIYAAPLAGGPSDKVDDATIYVPAAEPDEVWTITWPGGRIGQGRSTLRRVSLDGTVTYQSDRFDADRFTPLLGVPGGLAVEAAQGMAIWDAEAETISETLGEGAVSAASSNGRQLAWCAATCETTHHVALPATGPATAPHVAPGRQAIALSPDDRYLAVLQPDDDGEPNLVVTDLATGTSSTVATQGLEEQGTLHWTADSSQLFYANNSYQLATTTIGRFRVEDRSWEIHDINVGGGFGLITIDPDQAQNFFSTDLVSPDQCTPPGGYPSDREHTCTFEFGS